jgi:hypothetical protein
MCRGSTIPASPGQTLALEIARPANRAAASRAYFRESSIPRKLWPGLAVAAFSRKSPLVDDRRELLHLETLGIRAADSRLVDQDLRRVDGGWVNQGRWRHARVSFQVLRGVPADGGARDLAPWENAPTIPCSGVGPRRDPAGPACWLAYSGWRWSQISALL